MVDVALVLARPEVVVDALVADGLVVTNVVVVGLLVDDLAVDGLDAMLLEERRRFRWDGTTLQSISDGETEGTERFCSCTNSGHRWCLRNISDDDFKKREQS